MSEFYVEKRRVRVAMRLADGRELNGDLFLSHVAPDHSGPEWVGDLLNRDQGFVPCDVGADGDPRVLLYNRAYIVTVKTLEPELEQSLDPSYSIAPRQRVTIGLAGGDRLTGDLHIAMPEGRDRVSDFTSTGARFRYIETENGAVVVNFDHVVEITPENSQS